MCPWRVRAGVFAAFATTWCTLAEPAKAEPATIRLDYERPDTLADACPDAASFRNLVVARLGYDPFDPRPPVEGGAGDEVRVVLTPHNRRVQAEALLVRAGRPARSARALEGSLGECESVVAALATTLAIALDAENGLATPPTPPDQP